MKALLTFKQFGLTLLYFLLVQGLLAQSSDSPYEKEYKENEGMIRVEYGKKFGFLDLNRKEVIPLQYAQAYDFRDGLARVSIDGKKWGFIDQRGKVVIPFEYDNFSYEFRDGYIPALRGDKWGMINEKGKTIVPHQYQYLNFFQEGLASAAKKMDGETKWGFVNQNGTEVIPLQYTSVSYFNEGLAAVKQGGKWGFVNSSGELEIPLQYDEAYGFNEGRAPVMIRGKWGFIDPDNRLVIPALYDQVYGFKSNGETQVLQGTEGFFINREGQRLSKGQWLLIFTKGLKWGEQYWYRGEMYADKVNTKYAEGFSFTGVAHNLYQPELFLVMTKPRLYTQTYFYNYKLDQFWEKIKEMNKQNRTISHISYGNGNWSAVATVNTSSYREVILKHGVYPEESVEKYRKQGYSIISMAYGNGTWFVVMGNLKYKDQLLRVYSYNNWNADEVKDLQNEGYFITALTKAEDQTVVVFTKGTVIKEQLLLWSDEVPMREIKSYWDKGYESYLHFYLPRHVTIGKSGW